MGAEDIELLATSAYMLRRDDEYLAALERGHRAYVEASRSRDVRAKGSPLIRNDRAAAGSR